VPIHDHWRLLAEPADADRLPVRSPLIRSILCRRGIRDTDSYRRFADPTVSDLHEPLLIDGMREAVERIERAVREREAIVIYGDYDVDGVTSIVLLQSVLRSVGADIGFVVPHRLVDGYGLKSEVLERVLAERDVRLVITVDCGISSVEPVERALARGIDVIITDHHLPPEVLPAAAAVLNPKREGCEYPYKELAGAGVAFKLCCALISRFGKTTSVESLLKIAAIGTVADVAPLTGENRVIARLGLEGLKEVRNAGLRALLRMTGMYGRPLRATDVGFRIGPRINAAGRLASADTAIRLFDVASEEDAFPLVNELNRLNDQRQRIEREVLAAAEAMVDVSSLPRILILAAPDWHRGVLGLCAGRLAERFHRPVLLMSIDGDRCVGSGRSIRGLDLHHCLSGMRELFDHFGGHEFACGFSVPTKNLPRLREALQAQLDSFAPAIFERSIDVEGRLRIGAIDPLFLQEHEVLAPFGAANPQPVFLAEGIRVERRREFSPGSFGLTVRGSCGTAAEAVLWKSAAGAADALAGEFDALVELEPDARAAAGFRLQIRDAAPSGTAVIRNESPPGAV
jgi:single-stranded-DNA-specific exonuclease